MLQDEGYLLVRAALVPVGLGRGDGALGGDGGVRRGLRSRGGELEVVVGGGRARDADEPGGGQQREEEQRPGVGPAQIDRRGRSGVSDEGIRISVRGERRRVARGEARIRTGGGARDPGTDARCGLRVGGAPHDGFRSFRVAQSGAG